MELIDLKEIMDLDDILFRLDPPKNPDSFMDEMAVGHDGSHEAVDSDKPYQEVSEFPENSPVEDEEALQIIEAAKLRKEKDKQEAEEKAKSASPKPQVDQLALAMKISFGAEQEGSSHGEDDNEFYPQLSIGEGDQEGSSFGDELSHQNYKVLIGPPKAQLSAEQ